MTTYTMSESARANRFRGFGKPGFRAFSRSESGVYKLLIAQHLWRGPASENTRRSAYRKYALSNGQSASRGARRPPTVTRAVARVPRFRKCALRAGSHGQSCGRSCVAACPRGEAARIFRSLLLVPQASAIDFARPGPPERAISEEASADAHVAIRHCASFRKPSDRATRIFGKFGAGQRAF
jgi:hypothetical protein